MKETILITIIVIIIYLFLFHNKKNVVLIEGRDKNKYLVYNDKQKEVSAVLLGDVVENMFKLRDYLYTNIDKYFGNFVDWYNIQYYSQGDDYHSPELFNFTQYFVIDYAGENKGGYNASIYQITNSTSTGDVANGNLDGYNTVNSVGYNSYNAFGGNYSAVGVYNISLNKFNYIECFLLLKVYTILLL
jgi:hypothetical protein